jgi:hypothetical protein
MRQLGDWVANVASVAILVLSAASVAEGQTTQVFSDIRDAVPGKFFDAKATNENYVTGDRLIIEFNTGLDPKTWKYNDFKASTAAFSHAAATDTISFTVEAPAGFYIASITYSQQGSGSVLRTGKVSSFGTWIVDGVPGDLGHFGTNPWLSATRTFTGTDKTVVPVSITIGLSAFAAPYLGSATVAVTAADVVAVLAPLPVPEAAPLPQEETLPQEQPLPPTEPLPPADPLPPPQ